MELEERLLSPEVRRSSNVLECLLADDFVEFGGSGRVFDRAAIVRKLAQEFSVRSISLENFILIASAAELAVVSYRAVARDTPKHPPRFSLRSSTWIWRDGRWQMRFHQGTREPG